MMLDEIRDFIAAAQRHGMSEAFIQRGTHSLRVAGLTRDPVALAGGGEVVTSTATQDPTIRADQVGILRLRHPSGLGDAPRPGQSFKAGECLAYLQNGPVLKPVAAPVDGTVVEALAGDGDVIGYGTPLLRYAASSR